MYRSFNDVGEALVTRLRTPKSHPHVVSSERMGVVPLDCDMNNARFHRCGLQ